MRQQAWVPKSRSDVIRLLKQGLAHDPTIRRRYREVLQSLYPQAPVSALSDRLLIKYLANEIWFSRAQVINGAPRSGGDTAAMGGVVAAAGMVSQLDSPLPGPADVVALVILALGALANVKLGSHQAAYSAPQIRVSATPIAHEHVGDIAEELLEQSCEAPSAARAATDCVMLFHYTNRDGLGKIVASNVILPNAKGWVYATWLPYSPTDVSTGLTFDPRDDGKGEYVIVFTRRLGVYFVPGEQPNEIKHLGSLRVHRQIDVVYAGPNPLP